MIPQNKKQSVEAEIQNLQTELGKWISLECELGIEITKKLIQEKRKELADLVE